MKTEVMANLMNLSLAEGDLLIWEAIDAEWARQANGLERIASENFVSEAVLQAMGSVFTNKYAEGYPRRRYYGGCEWTDVVEQAAIDRARELFGAEQANVQPHSGAQANMAVYLAAIQYGDQILGMNLSHGGHLTHGHPMNFSGISYKVADYGVSPESEQIDYDELCPIAEEHKPKLIICGASAYPRIIDFQRIGQIAKNIGARMFADIAHIAGPIAAGLHPSPIPHADYVTSTTHKTLRGPRGGLILCKEEHAKEIDRKLFPGVQGGPLVHIIAAKAVAFGEGLRHDFKEYQQQILKNAKALASELQEQGLRLVSGGTDNHLMLVDVFADGKGITGKIAEKALEAANITINKNTIFNSYATEFEKSYLLEPAGQRHKAAYGQERTQALQYWSDIKAAKTSGQDVTEPVLSKLLPYSNTRHNREKRYRISIAPAITKDLRKW